MRTRVLAGGIEQSFGKAKQWVQNKRQAQAALALAVSLWIAGGGVAAAVIPSPSKMDMLSAKKKNPAMQILE